MLIDSKSFDGLLLGCGFFLFYGYFPVFSDIILSFDIKSGGYAAFDINSWRYDNEQRYC